MRRPRQAPNFLVTTLVGRRVAGLAGAAVATLAMCGPSCLLTYWIAKAWDRYRETEWRIAIGAGLAPVTVGFVFSSAFVLISRRGRQLAADAGHRRQRRRRLLQQDQSRLVACRSGDAGRRGLAEVKTSLSRAGLDLGGLDGQLRVTSRIGSGDDVGSGEQYGN